MASADTAAPIIKSLQAALTKYDSDMAAACQVNEDAWGAKQDELTDQINKLQLELAQYHPKQTVWGVTFAQSLTRTQSIEKTMGSPTQGWRTYPNGKPFSTAISLAKPEQVVGFSKKGQVYNPLLAGRGVTDAQLISMLQRAEQTAKQVPFFELAVDAEPDRKDRAYSGTQSQVSAAAAEANDNLFMNEYERVDKFAPEYAPHCTLTLNITGSQFKSRINRYQRIWSKVRHLRLDTYWIAGTASIEQGGDQDLRDAAAWCEAHGGVTLGVSEGGVLNNSNQLETFKLVVLLAHELGLTQFMWFDAVATWDTTLRPETAAYLGTLGTL